MKHQVLVITDDDQLIAFFKEARSSTGWVIDLEREALAGIRVVGSRQYSLVIVDDDLPGMRAFDVCGRLRQRFPHLRLLMCTTRSDDFERILGLELGADDAVTRPVSSRELVARAGALLRRAHHWARTPAPPRPVTRLRLGRLEIDLERRQVNLDSVPVTLSETQFMLLLQLASQPGRVVTREELTQAVWGNRASVSKPTLSMHVSRLRAKIEHDTDRPSYITTVQGIGYRFAEPGVEMDSPSILNTAKVASSRRAG